MKPRILILVPMVLGLSAILFALGRITAPSEVESTPTEVIALDEEVELPEAPLERESLVNESSTGTLPEGTVEGSARELLEAHYGKSWDEIEAEIGPILVPADRQLRLVPWESVAAGFREQVLRRTEADMELERQAVVGWRTKSGEPDWNSDTLNPTKKQLSQIDIQNLEHITNEYTSRLSDAKAELDSLMPAAVADQWDRGDYRKTPFFTPNWKMQPKKPGSRLLKRLSSSAGGWKIQFRLDSADYPELDRVAREIRRLRSERTQRAAEYIQGL